MTSLRYWDISPALDPNTPTWPGDTPFQQEWAARLDEQCPVNVGRSPFRRIPAPTSTAPCTTAPTACPSARCRWTSTWDRAG